MGKPGHDQASRLFPIKGQACEACGAPAYDRHHIDGNPENNVRSNIAFYCRRCHMDVDGRRGRLQQRIKQLNSDPEHQRKGGLTAGKMRATTGTRDELGRWAWED